jgi:hypothetical protein
MRPHRIFTSRSRLRLIYWPVKVCLPAGIDPTCADARGRMYYMRDTLCVQMSAGTRGGKRSGLRGGGGDFEVLSGV